MGLILLLFILFFLVAAASIWDPLTIISAGASARYW
jgi:hypothetical protein